MGRREYVDVHNLNNAIYSHRSKCPIFMGRRKYVDIHNQNFMILPIDQVIVETKFDKIYFFLIIYPI